MSERYLRELEVELGEVGIRGSRRRRILAETADHLRESGEPARFGEPRLIAARFAAAYWLSTPESACVNMKLSSDQTLRPSVCSGDDDDNPRAAASSRRSAASVRPRSNSQRPRMKSAIG